MSTRERWTVYPLLFLTLGITMRDKIVPPDLKPLSVDTDEIRCRWLRADSVRCGDLIVLGNQDNRCVELGATAGGAGLVEVFGPGDKMIFAAGASKAGGFGLCEVADAQGQTQVQLRAGAAGGQISLVDPTRRIEVALGHDGPGFSITGRLLDGDRTEPLELPCLWDEVFPQRPGEP